MYDPNSPAANQLLSVSQPIIQNNFTQIQNSFDVNHIDFDAGTNNGKHKYVEMPAQTSSPPIVFPAGELALYSFLNPTTAVNELYVNKTNQATVVQVPMTASTLSSNSVPAANTVVWTYLPSGLLIQSGGFTGTLSGSQTVNTNTVGIPNFNQIITVIVCPYNPTAGDLDFAVRLINITGATTFTVYVSSRTTVGAASGQTGFKYLAIGY